MGRLPGLLRGPSVIRGPSQKVAGGAERKDVLLLALKMEVGNLQKLEKTKKHIFPSCLQQELNSVDPF